MSLGVYAFPAMSHNSWTVGVVRSVALRIPAARWTHSTYLSFVLEGGRPHERQMVWSITEVEAQHDSITFYAEGSCLFVNQSPQKKTRADAHTKMSYGHADV